MIRIHLVNTIKMNGLCKPNHMVNPFHRMIEENGKSNMKWILSKVLWIEW